MCRDKGASSTSTLLTSGGSAAEARFIFVTYSEDWTNWVGAEEICRNQGYGLATIDADSEPTISAMMQAAGVNQVWSADKGANAGLMATIFQHGECAFVGRRFVNGVWTIKSDMMTWCSTPMGYICDTKTKAKGISPTVAGVLTVSGFVVLFLLLCCACVFHERLTNCVKSCLPKQPDGSGVTVNRA